MESAQHSTGIKAGAHHSIWVQAALQQGQVCWGRPLHQLQLDQARQGSLHVALQAVCVVHLACGANGVRHLDAPCAIQAAALLLGLSRP